MSVKFKKIHQGRIPFSKFKFRELVSLVENFSHEVVLEAKAHHRFTARSGNLERSVRNTINTKSKSITSTFILDNRVSNYGKYIHNGFRSWKPDPFLEQALERKLVNLKQLIKQKMGRKK